MAVDMFMKIGALNGESKDSAKTKWIDVLAWSWGMSNSGSAQVGGGAGAGKVNVQDLSFTKWIDKTSPMLMLACCNGKHFDTANLVVRKAGENPLEYLKIKMEDCLISSVDTGGAGEQDRLMETVTLNFATVHVDYTPQKADGSGDAATNMGWDIAANQKV